MDPNDPARSPELDAFVQLLRSSAVPSASTLAEARADLTASVPAAAGAGLGAKLGFVMVVLLSLASSPGAPPPPRQHPPRNPAAIPIAVAPEERVVPEPTVLAEPTVLVARAPAPVESRSSAPSTARTPPARLVIERAVLEPGAMGDGSGKQTDAPAAAPAFATPAPAVLDPAVLNPPGDASAAPSAELADALRAYSRERYAEAAVKLARVIEGSTEDAPARVDQAEFFLAKCLFHLELYHASASAFDEVTRRGDEHPYFRASLRWLAMLAERLPEPSGVIESVGRYDTRALATLDRPDTRAHYHHLLYLLGRARYEERRLHEAVRLFRQVPDESRYALEARFFEGVSHVRDHRARPALASFRRVIEAVRSGRTGGHDDPERLHDLAWMSAARLYYSLAMQAGDERASELLTLAIAAWRRIPLGSEHWLDSFFEETWALYVADEHGRALGHVHALESPYLRDRADPEALVLRAMIFYEHCQWDAAELAVARFHRRLDPVYAAAQRAARMAATNEDSFRMLLALRGGRSRVPPAAVPGLRAALRDRELTRHLANVRSIAREERRLASMSEPVLGSSLSARVAGDLAVVRALAEQRAGEQARERIVRFAAELGERMTQMDTIELELATQRRLELEHPNPLPMGPADGGRIVAVQGEQLWVFDGEWWRDELPFYVQEVEHRCGR